MAENFRLETPKNLSRNMSPEITPQAQSSSKYVYQAYPRHMHHKDGGFVVVQSEAEEQALGPDYARKPWPKEAAAVEPVAVEQIAAEQAEGKPKANGKKRPN